MTDQPVAVVTGASRGIGRGIAEELARQHAVVVNYLRNAEAANAVVQSITDRGGTAIAVAGDVGIGEHRHRLIEQTLQLGR